jgi:hypothetical protein
VEDEEKPEETNAILLDEWLNLPVQVTEWVFEESSNVLECSPLLGHIAGLPGGSNKLAEITISLLCKSSISQLNTNKPIHYRTCRSCQLSR